MGVRSDLEAAKKSLTDAAAKIDIAIKGYEEKKKKLDGDLKKAEAAVAQVAKIAQSAPGAAVPGLAPAAAAASSAVTAAAAAAPAA